jgi:Flp pilus assembly protein TadG
MKKKSRPQRLSLRLRSRVKAAHRIAAAVVEFAVTLPVVMILVFGAIEIASGIFLRQAISEAAYEGARAAARPTGTTLTTTARIREVLASLGVDNETVTFSRDPLGTPRGTTLTVSVSVPASELGSISPLRYLHDKTFRRDVTMVRM